jgi:5'-nucleotidase
LRWLILTLLALVLFTAQAQRIDLITFNDIYQIQPVDKGTRGGAARVAALVHRLEGINPNTLVLFAGDLLSPSVMSSAFQGAQMVDVFNHIGVNYASIGNHELDFGLKVFKQRVQESDFTWLNANILESDTGKPITGTVPDAMITVDGIKIGLFGVAYDFSSILKDASAVKFADPITTAKAEVKKLKDEGAQFVIAITHEGHAADCQLSAKVPDLDFIVGGHDHSLMMNIQYGHAPYVKATSDWRNIWDVQVDFYQNPPVLTYTNIPVTDALPEDPRTAAMVQHYVTELGTKFAAVLGSSTVSLDAVEKDVRAKETNLGDMIADAMRAAGKADVALMNGGGIRTDQVYSAGQLTKKDIYSILPFSNKLVVVKAKGSVLAAALENGVSQREKLAGRFPQVSGVSFTLEPNQPAGSRVSNIEVNGQPLDPNATYTVAINDYMYGGGDGYTMFENLPTLVAPDEGPDLAAVVSNYVKAKGTVSPQIEGRIMIKQ